MINTLLRFSTVVLLISFLGCAGQEIPHEPDIIDVTVPAPAETVTAAVIQVLTEGGYEVDNETEQHLTTGYRKEIGGPWNWLLRWRFGTGRSLVDAIVTPVSEQSTRLRLHVGYEGKDGIGSKWEDSPTALPQTAENQLRLIKSKLELL
ncbi:hypothetical protein [Petrachloros mirabilis]